MGHQLQQFWKQEGLMSKQQQDFLSVFFLYAKILLDKLNRRYTLLCVRCISKQALHAFRYYILSTKHPVHITYSAGYNSEPRRVRNINEIFAGARKRFREISFSLS